MPDNFLKIILILFLASGLGCQGYSVTGGPGKTLAPSLASQDTVARELVLINSILILPPSIPESMPSESNQTLFVELERVARQTLNLQILTTKKQLEGSVKTQTNLDEGEALKLAKQKGVDAVLVTTIYDFIEREGSKIGASQGASIYFSMSMLRASDAKAVWSASYHMKDQAASENLFSYGKRVKEGQPLGWRTGQQLWSAGVESAMQDFSEKRTAGFVGSEQL